MAARVHSPSLDGIHLAFDEAAAERAYWDAHYAELLEQYPEQFVAVKEEAVTAAAPTLDELLDKLRDAGIDDPRSVWVRFITAQPQHFTH